MQDTMIGAIALTSCIPKSIIPESGPICDSRIISPINKTADLESAAENDFPIAVPDSCFKAYVRALLFGLTCSKFPTNTAGVTITVVPAKTLCKATNAHLDFYKQMTLQHSLQLLQPLLELLVR